MQKIHPGQDVVSLFGIGSKANKTQAAAVRHYGKQRFFITLAAAFFVFVAVLFLWGVGGRMGNFFSSPENEPAAFQPGKFITEKISMGYMGR